MGISWKLPSWQVNPIAGPLHAFRCYDPELLYAELDCRDSAWPRQLCLEAASRAIAIRTVELFECTKNRRRLGWCCGRLTVGAPSSARMLASTSYEQTRGSLTFSSGTLSIGRLSSALCNASASVVAATDASPQGRSQDQETQRRLQELRWLHSVQSQIASVQVRKRRVMEVERDLDLVLCRALGIEAVDAIRLGARRQRIESWALLMTGISAAELVRAKRLRDSGRLDREDLLSLLSTIEQLVVIDDIVPCERREVWDRLELVRGLKAPRKPVIQGELTMEQPTHVATEHPTRALIGESIETLPTEYPQLTADTLSYAFVVHAVPVWAEETATGELPRQEVAIRRQGFV